MLAMTKGLTEPKSRPGLTVIAPSASSRESRLPTVAIAWGDERLLLWNPNTDQLQPASDGRYNNTVAQIPGLGIVTGSASGLKVWQASALPPCVRASSKRWDGPFRERWRERRRRRAPIPTRWHLCARPGH